MSDPWGWLPVTRTAMRREIAAALAHARGHAAGLLAHHDRQIRHRLAELERTHTAHVETTNLALIRLEDQMTADRDLLAQIAADLTVLATPIADLIASERAAKARVAELEGAAAVDAAGDLEAALAVKTAFDAIAEKFRAEPEVPDVEPLPDPEPTPEPTPEPETPAEPAPVDPDVE